MDNKTYSEKLKDPRWQKKRLEILEKYDFECQECGDKVSPLHVHHSYYIKGRNPWDYGSECLMCVCEKCHIRIHSEDKFLDEYVRKIKSNFSVGRNLLFFCGIIEGFTSEDIFDIDVPSYEFAEGLGIYFKKSADEIIDSLENGILKKETIVKWNRYSKWVH